MPIEKKPAQVTPTGTTSKPKAGTLPKQGAVSDQDLDKLSGGLGIGSRSTGAGAGKVTFNP